MSAARNVAIDYAWSPDSRSLAYVYTPIDSTGEKGAIRLGAVATIDVVDSTGKPLSAPARQEDRAGLLFNELSCVRWLKDGRLVFSSYELKLPATSRDMPQEWRLFVLDPKMGGTAIRVMPRDFTTPLMKEAPLFEITSNGRRALLPGPGGKVVAFDLHSADSTDLVDGDDPDGRLRSVAVWRGDDEACFIVPPGSKYGSPQRSEVVLWKDSSHWICLSKNWPPAAVDGWLTPERKLPTSMPVGK